MQLQPYISQPAAVQQSQQGGLQGLTNIVLAVQQQLASVSGTVYVPPLSSCPPTACAYFKWYKRYGIGYHSDGTKKPTITELDVQLCLAILKSQLDAMTFDEKVNLLREGYLSFTY